MALKFRRGTTAQKSGSLAFGEPYVNTTLGTLQIGLDTGDVTLSALTTASNVSVNDITASGNVSVVGNVTVGGQLTIGDQTSDTVNVVASLSSSLIPQTTNAFDLGSSTKIWRDLYISTGSIKIVDGSGNIVNTITNQNLVTTSSLASGSINLSASLPSGTVSGSSQVVDILGSLNTYTGSNNTKWNTIGNLTGSYATTGSNTLSGIQHIDGAIEIHSGSNTEIRLINTTTGIEYHIQNGDGGNFQIHNGTTDKLLFRFLSGSIADGNQDAFFYGNLSVSKSIFSPTITGINTFTGSASLRLTNLESTSASVNGHISDINTKTGSFENKFSTLQTLTASVNAQINRIQESTASLNSFTSSINTTIKSKLDTDGVVSGSSQITISSTTGFTSYSSSVDSRILTEKGRVDAILLAADADKDSFAEIVTLINSVDTTNDNAFASFYTSSVNRLNNLESTSASLAIETANLESFTSSINTTIKNKLNTDGVISGSSQVNFTQLSGISNGIVSSSSQVTPLLPTGTISGSTQLTSSYDGRYELQGRSVVSGSSQIDATATTNWATGIKTELNSNTVVSGSSQVIGILSSLNSYTASNDTTNTAQNSRLDQLSTASGSAISRLNTLESETLNLEIYTASFATASVALTNKTISGASNTLSNIGNSSLTNSSITIAGQSTALGGTITTETIRTAIGTVVTGSSQVNFTQLSGISANIISASSDTSNVDMIISGGSISANLYGGVVSGSAQVVDMLVSLNAYTASNDTKWSTLGSLSGSFARTNSANVFTGNQTITGSLFITQDLIVGGSSSIQNITSSNLVIGAAYVTLNTNTPSSRFAGLQIIDSGSAGSSGSFLYDAVQDEFIFVHKGNGLNVTSSHFILGPETYDNLGNESYLTNNKLPKGSGKEHLNDSNITDTGTLITLGSNSVVNGTFYATGTTLVSGSAQIAFSGVTGTVSNAQLANSAITIAGQSTSLGGSVTADTIRVAIGTIVTGSSQISHDSTTGYSANKHIDHTAVSITAGSGLTGGGDISATRTISIATGGVTDSMLAGSISNSKLTNSSITIAGQSTALGSSVTAETIRTAIGTVVTGSSQIDLTATTNYATGILTRLNTVGVFSGSSQVSHDSTTGYSANRHVDHTAVSITAGSGLTGGGDISTTRTISIANLGVTDAMLAGSISNAKLSNSAITIAGQSTSLGGSVTAETIRTAIGTVVTGSAQIAIASTSGFGTYINQAVLTTSSPTFAGLTINGSITATGDITAYYTSDKRHKNNIQIIPNALQKVSKLNGVTWEWNDDVNEVTKATPKTGLIAQDVQEVLPEVVREREDGFLSLDYSKMVGLLVEAIKEQQSQIHNLTLQVENLKKQKGL